MPNAGAILVGLRGTKDHWDLRRNPQITDGDEKPDAEPGVVSGVLLCSPW
jgi:hypothetical protein